MLRGPQDACLAVSTEVGAFGLGSEAPLHLQRGSIVANSWLGRKKLKLPPEGSPSTIVQENPQKGVPWGNPANAVGELIWDLQGGRVEEDRINVKS